MPKFDDYTESAVADETANDIVITKDTETGTTRKNKLSTFAAGVKALMGKVVSAVSADSVPWSGITGKPTFGNAATRDAGVSGGVALYDDPRIGAGGTSDPDAVHLSDYLAAFDKYGTKVPYDSQLDNFLFQADKRFSVTATGFSGINISSLFNGSPAGTATNLPPNAIGVVTIDLMSKGEYGVQTSGLTYGNGYVFISSYANRIPQSVSMRMKKSDGTWVNCPQAILSGSGYNFLWRVAMPGGNYYVAVELTFTAKPDLPCWMNQIECCLLTPDPGVEKFSGFNKGIPQTLYQPISFADPNNAVRVEINPSGRIYATRDLICDDASRGSVRKSPNGHYWRETISDAGVTSWTDLGTVAPN